jgi:hypothetical protein
MGAYLGIDLASSWFVGGVSQRRGGETLVETVRELAGESGWDHRAGRSLSGGGDGGHLGFVLGG